MTKTIQLPVMARPVEVRASTFDEAANTVEVIWTAGATVRRISWFDGEFDEELVVTPEAVRLERLNAGAPFLDSHDNYQLRSVIGSVVPGTAVIRGGKGYASVQLTRREDAAGVVQDIRDGIIRNVSVGYRILAVEKREEKDKVPLHRVVDWEPLEISAVAVPADAAAQIRSGAGRPDTFTCLVRNAAAASNEVMRIRMGMRARHADLAG